MSEVRSLAGTPNAFDFGNSRGTPVVVDIVTGRLYVIRQDGTVADCLLLSATNTWEDLRFPAQAINPIGAVADPSIETDVTKFPGTLLFSGTQDNLIAGVAQMPHLWADGTQVRPHVHWMKTTSAAGDVGWQFKWRTIIPGQAAGAWSAWINGIAAGINGAGNTADTHYVHQFGLLDMTGLADSSMIAWQVQRLGNTDSYNADARLLEFDIHFQIDRLGSETETPEA